MLKEAMIATAAEIETVLSDLLPPVSGHDATLIDAMRYGALDGGKRLRPFLVTETARLFDVKRDSALRAGAAVEMIHCYSLIHDDLPAMDDDDLRRGKPTTHKAYDEATAILAGDGLLTLAFEVLSDPETHESPAVRCQLVAALAKASGMAGMVGGQAIDIAAEKANATFDINEITRLQQMKTGALIAVSCEMGGLLGKASKEVLTSLRAYTHDIGLAFQIADDLLDHEGTEEEVGKKVGKDADAGKATFVSLLGADQARQQASMLADQAIEHLSRFDQRADRLRDVARFIVERKS